MIQLAAAGLCAAILAAGFALAHGAGVFGEAFVAATLGAGAIGGYVGGKTGAHVPGWAFAALPVVGLGAIVLGFTQYNDDGPSGALLDPFLYFGIAIVPVAVFAAGVVMGGGLRRDRAGR
jgi:hypothetical protein